MGVGSNRSSPKWLMSKGIMLSHCRGITHLICNSKTSSKSGRRLLAAKILKICVAVCHSKTWRAMVKIKTCSIGAVEVNTALMWYQQA